MSSSESKSVSFLETQSERVVMEFGFLTSARISATTYSSHVCKTSFGTCCEFLCQLPALEVIVTFHYVFTWLASYGPFRWDLLN